jgi:L-ribulose-5-phosphate 3-epimerase
MTARLGIMQGRLSKPLNGKIQSFPKDTWKKEFYDAKEIGFELIEWVLDENLEDNPIMNKNSFKIIDQIKKETQIAVNSICCDFFMTNSLSKKSTSFKDKNLEVLDHLIEEACPANNIKIIDLPLVKNESLKKKEIAEDYKNLLLNLEKKIIDNNLTISLETDLNPFEFKDFLKDFNKDAISVNYDTGNSAYWKFNAKEEFLSYGNQISNVHIKDCTPKDYTVELGSGNVNFKEIFNLLKKNKYKADFILQAARGKDEIQVAKKQLKFTKDYISNFIL